MTVMVIAVTMALTAICSDLCMCASMLVFNTQPQNYCSKSMTPTPAGHQGKKMDG
jgi:hypothetical protein